MSSGVFGRGEQEIDILAVLVLGYKQIPIIGMIRQDIVHARHSDDGADRRMGPDIGHLFSQAPDFPSVIQTFQILFYCFYHLHLSFVFFMIMPFLKRYIFENMPIPRTIENRLILYQKQNY